jgi:hypothetical protein
MKKVTFGIDVEYIKTDNGWKKNIQNYPLWGNITTSQKIRDGQTTVMRTGEEFGVMCLDLDTTNPEHPDAKLMMEEIYQLAPTVVQETQNGYHFFYKWDKRLAKSGAKTTKTKDSKLDIKSNMGLVNINAPVPYYKWWSHIKHELQEFTDEMWAKLRPNLTNKYLGIPLEKVDEIVVLDDLIEEYEKHSTEYLEKKIQKQQKKIDNYDKLTRFNDSEVLKARDYPIRKLLNEPTATLIRCISPDHNDKTPSMQITGNFAYCHGCGKSFDALDIYQILNDCDFKTALNKLTNK